MPEGSGLGFAWTLPFAGLLLSLALVPLVAPPLWHRHGGKLLAFWALAFVLPFAASRDPVPALGLVLETLGRDYVPFIILLGALYTVTGGIRLTGRIEATPSVNTLMLLIGTLAASVMGTTGAAMLVLPPLIRANRWRRANAHVFVFFIILVANIGGGLSPLGDPPLLLGFLQGVPFFWPTVHLLAPTAIAAAILLVAFYGLDRRFHRRGGREDPDALAEIERLGIDGKRNLILLALIPACLLVTGAVPGIAGSVLGNVGLLLIAAASWWLTPAGTRAANEFSWEPIVEVGRIFAAIFVTMIPVLALLRAEFAHAAQPSVAAYFWLTGGLSSLLDNAPTYLIFFNAAGGDATALTGPLAGTLTAISLGAVMMGANTYIGNAPNLMVKAICEERGIAMPGFFTYTAWACGLLLPIYALLSVVFFR